MSARSSLCATGGAIAWLGVYLATSACTCQGTTFSPPLLAASPGMRPPQLPGGGEFSAAVGVGIGGDAGCSVGVTPHGMARLAVVLTRRLDIEAGMWGADVPNAPEGQTGRGRGVVIGSVGLRAHPLLDGWFRLALAAGGGLGCGGAHGGPGFLLGGCRSRGAGAVAGGGYLGVDLGAQVSRRVVLYLNSRLQLSRASHLPATFWGSHLAGVAVGRTVSVALEAGPTYLVNEVDRLLGGVAAIAVAARWDVVD